MRIFRKYSLVPILLTALLLWKWAQYLSPAKYTETSAKFTTQRLSDSEQAQWNEVTTRRINYLKSTYKVKSTDNEVPKSTQTVNEKSQRKDLIGILTADQSHHVQQSKNAVSQHLTSEYTDNGAIRKTSEHTKENNMIGSITDQNRPAYTVKSEPQLKLKDLSAIYNVLKPSLESHSRMQSRNNLSPVIMRTKPTAKVKLNIDTLTHRVQPPLNNVQVVPKKKITLNAVGKQGLYSSDKVSPCCRKARMSRVTSLCGESFNETLQSAYWSTKGSEPNSNESTCTCFDYMYCKLVIVTAFSSNHFNESKDLIGSVQTHLPYTKLIIFDIGLQVSQIEVLRSYCNVELRTFDFSKYPKHVHDLHTYAFKPLIVQDIAYEYEIINWADASVRFQSFMPRKLFGYLLKFPFVSGSLSYHPSVSLTHDGTLKYLDLNLSRPQLGKQKDSLQATVFLVHMNSLLRKKFLNYWIDCALHSECIAPNGSTVVFSSCNFTILESKQERASGTYIGCHRYDQSAMNLILIREFGLNVTALVFHSEVRKVWTIEKKDTNSFTVKYCPQVNK